MQGTSRTLAVLLVALLGLVLMSAQFTAGPSVGDVITSPGSFDFFTSHEIASLTLPRGDWDVHATVLVQSAHNADYIELMFDSDEEPVALGDTQVLWPMAKSADSGTAVLVTRKNLSHTSTYRLRGYGNSSSLYDGEGQYTIRARRMR